MTTNIHVRAVDDELAAAAKRRAASTNRSVSAYVRDLIADDVAKQESRNAIKELLDEISANPSRPRVDRAATADALAEAKRDIGAA